MRINIELDHADEDAREGLISWLKYPDASMTIPAGVRITAARPHRKAPDPRRHDVRWKQPREPHP